MEVAWEWSIANHSHRVVLEIFDDTTSLAGAILHSEITIMMAEMGGGAMALVNYIFIHVSDDRVHCNMYAQNHLQEPSTSSPLKRQAIVYCCCERPVTIEYLNFH
jgi:hypothetical protein